MSVVSAFPFLPTTVVESITVPEPVRPVSGATGAAFSFSKLPGDAIGSFSLVLTNIQGGSRYRIERAGDGSLASPGANAEGVVAGSGAQTVTLLLDYYPPGNSNNNLRIKARKASATPIYRPYESQANAQAGTVTVFVSQESDE